MKKFLVPLLAIVMALGGSAFTDKKKVPSKPLTNYIWFNVDDGYGNLSALTDGEVTFNSALSSAPSSNPGCNQMGLKNCVVGFTEDQVDNTGQHLKSGSQDIQDTYYTRSAD